MSVLDQFSLDGETAFVTGGARGLGEEMAIALTEAGADVAIADVDIDAAESTATALEKTDSTTTAVASVGPVRTGRPVALRILSTKTNQFG